MGTALAVEIAPSQERRCKRQTVLPAREKRENWRASAPENAEPASPPSCPGEDFYHHARDRPQRHWKKPPRDQPPSPRAQRIASFISRMASAASLPPAALVRSQYHIPGWVGGYWKMAPRRQHSVCPKNDGARDRRCCLRERKEKTGEPAPLKTPSPPRLHLAPGRTFTTTRGTGPSATGKSPPGTSLRLPALNGLHLLSLAWPQRPACRQLRLCAANTIFPPNPNPRARTMATAETDAARQRAERTSELVSC